MTTFMRGETFFSKKNHKTHFTFSINNSNFHMEIAFENSLHIKGYREGISSTKNNTKYNTWTEVYSNTLIFDQLINTRREIIIVFEGLAISKIAYTSAKR